MTYYSFDLHIIPSIYMVSSAVLFHWIDLNIFKSIVLCLYVVCAMLQYISIIEVNCMHDPLDDQSIIIVGCCGGAICDRILNVV